MNICMLTLISHQDTCPVLLTHHLNVSPLTAFLFNQGLSLLSWPNSRFIILSVVRHTSVTVHGFPVPSSPCLVCVRVRMCEQVSVGVCD